VLSEVSDAVALEEAALAMRLEPLELPRVDRPAPGDVVASAA
jgi:hypothetical protein